MAKITKLEQKTYQGKPNGFKVTLDNGTEGNLKEKDSDKGLRVGDEVVVTLEPYTNKKGEQTNLIILKLAGQTAPPSTPAQPQRPSIHVGAGKSKEEMKAEGAIRLMETIIEKGYFGGKIEAPAIAPLVKEQNRLLWSEIDECYSTK